MPTLLIARKEISIKNILTSSEDQTLEGETVEIEQGASGGYKELTIEELNKELDQAVADEDYEKAAKLRDEISKRN